MNPDIVSYDQLWCILAILTAEAGAIIAWVGGATVFKTQPAVAAWVPSIPVIIRPGRLK